MRSKRWSGPLRRIGGLGAGALVTIMLLGADEAPTPLAEAIREFNAKAKDDPIGKEQPPLTEEEVIAAIRWSSRSRAEAAAKEDYDAFAQIAETKLLPPGAEFEVLTSFQPDDENVFTAWSVRIRINKAAGDGSYAFSIRDRWIGWRSIGPEERKVLDKWNEYWRKQGGVASFDRPKYARERAEAIEKDRAAAAKKP